MLVSQVDIGDDIGLIIKFQINKDMKNLICLACVGASENSNSTPRGHKRKINIRNCDLFKLHEHLTVTL